LEVRTVLLLAAAATIAGAVLVARAGGAGSSGPTYYRDVAPILDAKCASCHRLGGIAPFPLATAADATAHAAGIVRMTKAGLMPPWMPGPDSAPIIGRDHRRLTPAELRTLAAWAASGAHAGNPADRHSRPSTGAGLGGPGTTITLRPPHPYVPHATGGGIDDYHCFLLDPRLKQNVFVTGALIQPQRTGIVHHVILYEAAGPQAAAATRLNAASGGKGWTCFGGPGLSETHPTGDSATGDRLGAPPWIAAWVPGHANNDLPKGTGVLVHAGAAIVMQVHYNLIHPAKRDRSRAVIRFAPAATTKLTPLNTILVPAPVELPCPRGVQSTLCSRDVAVKQEIKKYGYNAALIPAGLLYICGKSLADYPQAPANVKSLGTSCDRRVNRPLRIYGVAGHMHTRGVDIRVELNGKTLLHIPRWNFHWQDAYYLAKPVDANPGDVIHVSCTFDNSAIKQPLVNGRLLKPRYVLWGEGTTDEMCLGLLQAADR
jgi:hypothetical protein